MSAPTPAPSRSTEPDDAPPPWSLGEVGIGVLAMLFLSSLAASVVFAVAGIDAGERDDASMIVIALGSAGLWLAMGATVLVVCARHRVPIVEALRLRVRALDVPLGIAVGVVAQLVLVPVVSWPWLRLLEALGHDPGDLEEPACRLAEKADDPLGIALFVLVTVVGAPIAEEVFFRGFVQRAAVARMGRVVGVIGTAALFGLVHYQLEQLLALVVFGVVLGVLADRTGRLGPSIITHMAFNATTVVNLLLLSSSLDDVCESVLGVLR